MEFTPEIRLGRTFLRARLSPLCAGLKALFRPAAGPVDWPLNLSDRLDPTVCSAVRRLV